MKKSIWIAFVALMVIALVVGCAPMAARRAPVQSSGSSVKREDAATQPSPAPALAEAPSGSGESYGATGTAVDTANADERMIIRTATMAVIVEDTDKTLQSLNETVKSYKGYIADSRLWHENDQLLANVVLRVPAQSLDEFLSKVRGMVLKVDTENISGQDVTEEYADVQARLKNLELTEKELQVLLTEVRENRGKAEDILAVYQKLTEIRGQIEQMKGRQQFLERMTALATVQIDIRPKEAPRSAVEKYKWDPLVIASDALRSFVNFVQGLATVAIYLIIFSPIVLVPIAAIWLLVWLLRRGRRKAAPKQ